MRALAEFDPHLAGTLPLGLDLPTSDLDILCHAAEPDCSPLPCGLHSAARCISLSDNGLLLIAVRREYEERAGAGPRGASRVGRGT